MTRAHVPGSIDACVDTRFMIGSASYARQHTGSRRIARKLRRHNSRLKCSAGGKFQAEYSLTPPPTEMMSLVSNVQPDNRLVIELDLGVCSLLGFLHSDLPGVFGTGIHPGCSPDVRRMCSWYLHHQQLFAECIRGISTISSSFIFNSATQLGLVGRHGSSRRARSRRLCCRRCLASDRIWRCGVGGLLDRALSLNLDTPPPTSNPPRLEPRLRDHHVVHEDARLVVNLKTGRRLPECEQNSRSLWLDVAELA